MKPTQEQVVAWYEQANGWSPEGWDETVNNLTRLAALAYEAGRKDEREWQGLTDETYWEMWVESPSDVLRFAHAIEAKLKEKNT